MEDKKIKSKYAVIVIPAAIINGIIGGITSVITAYFFKPLWNKIIVWWNNDK